MVDVNGIEIVLFFRLVSLCIVEFVGMMILLLLLLMLLLSIVMNMFLWLVL